MGRRFKKKRNITPFALFVVHINKTVNYFNQIIGDNNTIDNIPIPISSKSFSFVGKINFTSRNGKIFYGILMLLLISLLTFCIMSLKPAAYIIAMTLIPSLFFIFGKQYLKQNEDKNHLKIHKILMFLIVFAIVLFCVISICFPLIGKSATTIGCILMAFDLMICLALYFNALGGSKIVDFVMGTFINFSEN